MKASTTRFKSERKSLAVVWGMNLIGFGLTYAANAVGFYITVALLSWVVLSGFDFGKLLICYLVSSVLGSVIVLFHNAHVDKYWTPTRRPVDDSLAPSLTALDTFEAKLEKADKLLAESGKAVLKRESAGSKVDLKKYLPEPLPAKPLEESNPPSQAYQPSPLSNDTPVLPTPLESTIEKIQPVLSYDCSPAQAPVNLMLDTSDFAPPKEDRASEDEIQNLINTLNNSLEPRHQAAPFVVSLDYSLPALDSSSFSFDFSSALPESPLEAVSQSCEQCGAPRESKFAFCLRCGTSHSI